MHPLTSPGGASSPITKPLEATPASQRPPACGGGTPPGRRRTYPVYSAQELGVSQSFTFSTFQPLSETFK